MAINIKRDYLDIILTDSLPTELPINFSLFNFYDYLSHKKTIIDEIKKELVGGMANRSTMFNESFWDSVPLKFSIKKGDYQTREISIPSPLALLVIQLFLSIYERDIILALKRKSIFSLRYHTKNNQLYYKKRNKSIIEYYDQSGKDSIQQTGMYFSIVPYRSLLGYLSSRKWLLDNRKFSFFAKIDYKDCFGSIYTHSYKWITTKNAIDSIEFSNNSLLTVIDKILQRINGKQTNGIIVGPEFSRMIAEVMLQEIDYSVYNKLIEEGFEKGVDYEVSRFVDDIYVFSHSKNVTERILSHFEKEASNFHIKINESKLIVTELPYNHSNWIQDVSVYTDRLLSKMFRLLDRKFSFSRFNRSVYMREFNIFISEHKKECKNIVSYLLSSIQNKLVEIKKNKFEFDEKSVDQVKYNISLIMFFHSFAPNYDNTQKFISILFLIDEIDSYFSNESNLSSFADLVKEYSFVFEEIGFSDVVNYVLLCAKFKIELPYKVENRLIAELSELRNPLNYAVFLIYAGYNKEFQLEFLAKVSGEIEVALDNIIDNRKLFMYQEFWWIVIFMNCPFLSPALKVKMASKFPVTLTPNTPSERAIHLINDYFTVSGPDFFSWDIEKIDIMKKIMFKTNLRTVFKRGTVGTDDYGLM